MKSITFILSFLLLAPNAFAQSNLFDKFEYRFEIGVWQNSLTYDVGPNSTTVSGNSQIKFDNRFILPNFQASAIFPLGKNIELDINASYLVFGGKKHESSGYEEFQKIKSIGFGITPSYLITDKLRLGFILEDNIIQKAETTINGALVGVDSSEGVSNATYTYKNTNEYNKHVLRSGLRIDYRIGSIVLAGKYSLTLTDLLDDQYFNDISQTNHNFGLSIGYRFRK